MGVIVIILVTVVGAAVSTLAGGCALSDAACIMKNSQKLAACGKDSKYAGGDATKCAANAAGCKWAKDAFTGLMTCTPKKTNTPHWFSCPPPLPKRAMSCGGRFRTF